MAASPKRASSPEPVPFLKWAGGKRSQLKFLKERIGPVEGNFVEPFLGGGAVMFGLSNEIKGHVIAGDLNTDLIVTYEVVRDSVEDLIDELDTFRNEKDFYLSVRAWDRQEDYSQRSKVERAARFIYLNRTGFNGLYRVNSQGFFNVPFGLQSYTNLVNFDNLRAVSEYLRGRNGPRKVKLVNSTYKSVTKLAKYGDTVYFDPPYDPLTPSASFVSYQKGGFGKDDQRELMEEARRLAALGCRVFISNSCTPFIESLYSDRDEFIVHKVSVPRQIGASTSSRGRVQEVLIEGRSEVMS
jgi:DNA adenine methylase